MTTLTAWQNFYVIVGSSAGALIGLQFVVMSLITSAPNWRIDPTAGAAFATPTIMHFSTALLIASILCAPWDAVSTPAALCGVIGSAGIVYATVITGRMRRQTAYQPEFEDWLCHSVLPYMAYSTLCFSAFLARSHAPEALLAVAAAALLLLFIGIHNAWDAVTYHIFMQRRKGNESSESDLPR